MDDKRAHVLGCPISKLTLEQVVERLEEFIHSRKPQYISVVNVAKIVKMRSDKALDASVRSASVIGADGVPLVWASRLLGDALPGRVNGTDLMFRLLERADEKGYRVFFFGAQEKILQEVVARVRSEYPGVEIAGSQNGYFKPEDEWNIVRKIRSSRPDIIFIAFGTPKKEIWVGKYLQAMGVPVVHGVGGSFDVFSGLIPRAPVWMQKAGLEWFFRLLQEPRRMWKRYLVTNSVFVALLLKEFYRTKFRPADPHSLTR
jgi:N-acetylglucosaminyldiphosphoundecaprenol N-acetyl-beta-D-mannosaminyltransferase